MNDYFSLEIGEIRKLIAEHNPQYSELSDEKLKELTEKMYEVRLRQVQLNDPERAAYYSSLNFRTRRNLIDSVYESIRGLGILGKIMADKSITEIMINGFDNIFVERAGKLERLADKFESQERLRNIITKFVQEAGRSVNESNPIVDTRLKDGSRVNVVLDPIALDGPIVTIRRFPEEGMTIQKLIQYGSITPEAAIFLEKLVRAKYNIFISKSL